MAAKPASKFYVGAVAVQLPEALDRFVATAPAGAEFVYCEAPEPQYGETWSRAGEHARSGLVRTLSRRRAGGGWEYYCVRTGRSLPAEQSLRDKTLGDRATAAIFAQLKREANMGLPCSSDEELRKKAGLTSRNQASWRFKKLLEAGLIQSTLAYENGVPSRVVTIVESGKTTALPKKWAALKRAAEREQQAATGGAR
jgi:hypothetical protein